ncbi:uncharacterized protein si:ch211-151h10.2 isoform X2 [Carassius gibelio]|uniref:uncharacterized protein si:ch211-151h10.2 isoform X2 n=1 Tax=Carassius gibelio TaxID=101364 RepID=UPI002277A9AB|nr:uncharacterized protein si:ch211-151h10.2 isoform X2 [Carassius gibelio]
MPQLSVGNVWSCWERSRTRSRGEGDGAVEDKQMISRELEERAGQEWTRMRLHWRNWPRWSPFLALMCLVLLEESPLHPSVSLPEAAGRLLLAGLLCAALALCAPAFQFLLRYEQKVKQHLPCNGEVIVRQTAENQQSSIHPQQDAGHLETQAVSRTLHRKSCEEGPEEKEKCALQDRVNSISSYLRDRVSGLRSLLQVQRECDVSVCAVQSGLHKRWALLEELHTRVTLRPDSTQEALDPHAVLTDTESLFSELSQFKIKVQQCRTQLEANINLLQTLRSSHQRLKETFSATIDSVWTKELLQSNTDLFSEILEDFMSLEQQTSNFVIHLRGLKASEEEKTKFCVNQSRLSLPAVPVYVAAPEASQLNSDPESDPESPEASQKTRSRTSAFHMLCGSRRRKSSP